MQVFCLSECFAEEMLPQLQPKQKRMVASQEEQLVPDTELDTGTRM